MDKKIRLIFEEFFTVLSDKYNIDKDKLKKSCLPSLPSKPVPRPHSKETSALFEAAKSFISEEIPAAKLTVDKLKEMCRLKVLKVSGKKDDLIHRLENPMAPENKGGKSGTRKKKCLFKPKDVSKIIEKLRGSTSKLAICKNASGHYVHLESGLVFDPKTQKAIGKWKDEQVKWLNKADVEMCIRLKVNYELPENLDLGSVKVVDKKLDEELGDEDFKDDVSEEDEDGEDGEVSDED